MLFRSKIALSPNASGTGTFTIQAPNSNTNRTLDLPDAAGSVVVDAATQTLTNKTLTSPTITGASVSSMASSVLTLATAQNSTSGTSIDFTGIPSWVKRISILLNGVSTNGSSPLLIQAGPSGGVDTTSYNGGTYNPAAWAANTNGFLISAQGGATFLYYASARLELVDASTNTWLFSSVGVMVNGNTLMNGGGSRAFSGVLSRVRITTSNGTDTFDAGQVNIIYE